MHELQAVDSDYIDYHLSLMYKNEWPKRGGKRKIHTYQTKVFIFEEKQQKEKKLNERESISRAYAIIKRSDVFKQSFRRKSRTTSTNQNPKVIIILREWWQLHSLLHCECKRNRDKSSSKSSRSTENETMTDTNKLRITNTTHVHPFADFFNRKMRLNWILFLSFCANARTRKRERANVTFF